MKSLKNINMIIQILIKNINKKTCKSTKILIKNKYLILNGEIVKKILIKKLKKAQRDENKIWEKILNIMKFEKKNSKNDSKQNK